MIDVALMGRGYLLKYHFLDSISCYVVGIVWLHERNGTNNSEKYCRAQS